MRIKKIAAIGLCAVMAIGMCACTAKENVETTEATVTSETVVAEEKFSFDEAAYLEKITEEVTANFSEITMEDGIVELYSASPDVKEYAEQYKGAKIDTSKDYYEIMCGDSLFENVVGAMSAGDEVPELGDTAKNYFGRLMLQNLGSMCNGQRGVECLAFTAIYNYSRTYVPDGVVADRARIIPTDKDICYWVNYANTGDGAITVSVSYIFFDENTETFLKTALGERFKKISR